VDVENVAHSEVGAPEACRQTLDLLQLCHEAVPNHAS
jgi:hypothetical protein